MTRWGKLLLLGAIGAFIGCGESDPSGGTDGADDGGQGGGDGAAAVDGGAGDATDLTPGQIACGDEICEGDVELCVGCVHGGADDAHCDAREGEAFFAEAGRIQQEHGCGFPSLYLECDDPVDCGAGRRCVFTGGENGYAYCVDENEEWTWGVACTDAEACSTEAPVCGPIDPFGYFAPFEELLGWLPRGCDAPR